MSATAVETTLVPRAVADAIAAEGVDLAFGLMGAGTIAITHHLETEHQVRYVPVRHESASVGAADGYARVTGKVGVALVTWGPGVTNTVTSLTTAKRAGTPVVLVAGDCTTAPLTDFPFAAGPQGLDQVAFFDSLGVPTFRVDPENVHSTVARAFATARTGQVVALLMPAQFLLSASTSVRGPREAAPDVLGPDPGLPAVDTSLLEEAATALRSAERPLVLIGRGACLAHAQGLARRLATAIGAPVVTSIRALGAGHGDEANLGVVGGFAPPSVAEFVDEADVVVVLGATFNQFTTRLGTLFERARLVQFDTDAAVGRGGVDDIMIIGDLAQTLPLVLDRLPDRTEKEFRRRAVAMAADGVPRYPFVDESNQHGMDPRTVSSLLGKLLPRPRGVVVDTAGICEFPIEYIEAVEHDEVFCMWDFGAVGSGLGGAIGAALGRPDRLTTAVVGDGGLMMSLGELDTAVRARVPLLVVCMNNRAYGSERYHMKDWDIPEAGAFFATPDLSGVARSLGCRGEQVRTVDELARALAHLDLTQGPYFLDCLLTDRLIAAPMRDHS